MKFKSRLEMFLMKIRLFGFREPWGVGWKDIKELFTSRKLRCLNRKKIISTKDGNERSNQNFGENKRCLR